MRTQPDNRDCRVRHTPVWVSVWPGTFAFPESALGVANWVCCTCTFAGRDCDPSAALDVNLDVDVDRDVGKKDVPLQSDDDMPALEETGCAEF